MKTMPIVKIVKVNDSKLVKWKVRVKFPRSGYEYTSSYHKTKLAAQKAANKIGK